jgi:transcription-repair coupling factor (superfamily II helicase)
MASRLPVLNTICHFFEQTSTLFDYLPEAPHFALVGNIDETIQRFWTDTRSRYQFLKSDRERPVLPPESVFLRDEDFLRRSKRRRAGSLLTPKKTLRHRKYRASCQISQSTAVPTIR